MVPTLKTHLSVLAQNIPALQPDAKDVGDKRNSGNIFEFSVQNYIRNRCFSSWDKIFVDQCNCRLYNAFKIHTNSKERQ